MTGLNGPGYITINRQAPPGGLVGESALLLFSFLVHEGARRAPVLIKFIFWFECNYLIKYPGYLVSCGILRITLIYCSQIGIH